MKTNEVITIDADILGGTPVFSGTRVPVWSLFAHLERGISLEDFLADFPSVAREQAIDALEIANKLLTSKFLNQFYEIAA